MADLFNVKCFEADGKSEVYVVALDQQKSLSTLRGEITGELALPEGWVYLRGDDARLTKSAEEKTTLADLLADKTYTLTVRLPKPDALQKAGEPKTVKDDRGEGGVKGEEDAAKAIKSQLDRLDAKLTEMKESIARPKEKLLSDDDRAAPALPSGGKRDDGKWGGRTGKATRELKHEELAGIVRSLGLPRTARRNPDGTFVMAEFAARLRPPQNGAVGASAADPVDTLARLHTVAANEVETRVESFREAWQKRSFESGFSNISASLQASFPMFGGRFGGSASVNRTKQTEQSKQEGGSTLYVVGSQEVRKARVFVPRDMIALSEDVQRRFAATTTIEELPALLDDFGYFVITEYVLGAKLYTSDKLQTSDRSSAEASDVELQVAAALSYKSRHGEGGASGGVGSGDSGKRSDKSANERLAFRLQAKGGSATDRYDPQAWIHSIEPNNWEVIAYGGLIPIYEFINDPDVRQRCIAKVQEQNERFLAEGVRRWATNSSGILGGEGAEEISPKWRGGNNGQLKDMGLYAHTGWVKVPKDKYFRGAQLSVRGDRLTLTLLVVNEKMEPMPHARADMKGISGDDHKEGKQLTNGSGLFFDTSPLMIPPGHRITALRLRRLEVPNNRIGLEVAMAEGIGPAPSSDDESNTLCHQGNNHSYMDTDMGKVFLSVAPTVAPEGTCIAGIHLADLGGDNTLGIRLLVHPVEG